MRNGLGLYEIDFHYNVFWVMWFKGLRMKWQNTCIGPSDWGQWSHSENKISL